MDIAAELEEMAQKDGNFATVRQRLFTLDGNL